MARVPSILKRLTFLSLIAGLTFPACRGGFRWRHSSAVVVITIDTLRADHLPCYGYRGVATPAIDALRRDSTLYVNAYSHVPLTLPSHTTLLTGLLPFENGVRDNVGFRLAPDKMTIAGLLKSRGYATGAAVSSYVLRRDRGLAAGFDFYDDSVSGPRKERAGGATAAALEGWARGIEGQAIFLFLHLYEPHAPYEPPEPYRTAYRGRPYDGEIATADAAVGDFLRFLKERGLYTNALIVLAGDHGEGLGDHGEDEHGVFLYREDVRVPLLVKFPGTKGAGATVTVPAGLTDVFPTVAEAVRAAIPPGVKGMSLRRLALPNAPHRDIYSESLYPRFAFGWSDLASLENARTQYIQAPSPELYDMATDPGELRNLAPGRPSELRRLAVSLAGIPRPFQPPSKTSAEEVRTLASLGYLSGATTGADEKRPDPKDHIQVLKSFRRLFERDASGDRAGTIAAAREVIREDPSCFSAWEMLSDALFRTGKGQEACDTLLEAIHGAGKDVSAEQLTQAYDNLSVLFGRLGRIAEQGRLVEEAIHRGLATEGMKADLARLRVAQGNDDGAIELLRGVANPDPASLCALGIALARRGRKDEAADDFQRALRIDPRNAEAAFDFGTLLLEEHRTTEAKEWLGHACEWRPRWASAWASLGLAHAEAGESAPAREAWTRAIEIDPREPDALFNLGLLDAREGRGSESMSLLSRFVSLPPPAGYAPQLEQSRQILARIRAGH